MPFAPANFHESIEMDPVELTALFMQAGMSVEQLNHAGVSPVQVAAIRGKAEHLQLLIDKGADLAYEDPVFSSNVTDFAVVGGNPDILQIVLDAGAPAGGGPASMPILIDAVQSHSLEMFHRILSEFPDTSVTDKFGQSPLMHACLAGEKQMAEELMDAGADINAVEPRGGTMLGAAAFAGDWELVDFLIAHGADPLQRYRGGRTLLFELARHPDWPRSLAQSLLEQGIDLDAVEELGNSTALIAAARTGNLPMVSFLLENGADPGFVDATDNSACDYARLAQNGEMLILFARYGVTSDKQFPVD
ncbi:MAG: ankyrin repeat domain-containing protein [bacterium]